jgi:hypothetical protein
MSDLAPFVASVLYDRVLAETKQEVDHLSEQLQKTRAVQIISANGTVYAEGQFEDGSYGGNPNLWLVNLPKQLASCPLSDLADVEICLGGICKADFSFGSIVEGWVGTDGYTYVDGWAYINFCFGGAGNCWLWVKVGPFPSEEDFFAQLGRDTDMVDAEHMAPYLTRSVAAIHPELSVTFEKVIFFVSAVKGFIQNLDLDPAFEEEV